MNKVELGTKAVQAALRLRAAHGISATEGVCPFDLAHQLGISTRFVSLPSLEGMYSPSPKPAIILGAERPVGRCRYTCGHEIGHHVFGHGYRIDELAETGPSESSPEEYLAQRFSGALLMPKLAVAAGFSRRGWQMDTAQAASFYSVSRELGVGYSTLLIHQQINLKQISGQRKEELLSVSLSSIREEIAGFATEFDVFSIDSAWGRPTADVEVGDVIILPLSARVKGKCVSQNSNPRFHYVAIETGFAQIESDGSERFPLLRVSKRGFTGLARYRHLEESDDV